MRKPVLLSWSGGKDAAWTLHALRQRDDVEVVGLLTTITEGYERIAMQGIRVDVLHAQAAAAGLPVIEARIPQRATTRSTRQAFADALQRRARTLARAARHRVRRPVPRRHPGLARSAVRAAGLDAAVSAVRQRYRGAGARR